MDQYSLGSSSVVTLRSPSVMIQRFGYQLNVCSASIRLGEDADKQFPMNLVHGFELFAGLQGSIVGLPFEVGDVAPVATGMAQEVRHGIEATFTHQAIDAFAEDQRPDGEKQVAAIAAEIGGCHGRYSFIDTEADFPAGKPPGQMHRT